MLQLGRSRGTSAPAPTSGRRGAETLGSGPSAIHVEYSPRMDGDPDPGEVVWTWVTYEDDPSQGKDRPVVIIGRRGALLAGVALTSKRHDREPQVAVGTGSWDSEGRPSYAKVDRVLDVEPGRVRREGAILDQERFAAVVDGVRRELAH